MKTIDIAHAATIDEAYHVWPIGRVHSPLQKPSLKGARQGISRQGAHVGQVLRENDVDSQIVIDPRYLPLLEGLEQFSHLVVIYWPHLLPEEGRQAQKVHPAGFEELPLTDVFATCSPARPNPLLVTVARLLAVDGNVLTIHGLEAVDGTPVLDIKPYNTHYLAREDVRAPQWMDELNRLYDGM